MAKLDLDPALSERARYLLATMAASGDPHAFMVAEHLNARSWGPADESDDVQLRTSLSIISMWCEYLTQRICNPEEPVTPLDGSDDRMVRSIKQTVEERFPDGVCVVRIEPAIGAGQSIRVFSGKRVPADNCLAAFRIMRAEGNEGQLFLFANARDAWMFARSSGKVVRPSACHMVLQIPGGESTGDMLRTVEKKRKKTKKRRVKKKKRSVPVEYVDDFDDL